MKDLFNHLFFSDDDNDGGDTTVNKSVINEKLLALTEEVATLKLKIKTLEDENDQLNIDFSNKLATNKVDFETREIKYKQEIRNLRAALELRDTHTHQRDKSKKKVTANQLWDEAINHGK